MHYAALIGGLLVLQAVFFHGFLSEVLLLSEVSDTTMARLRLF